MLIVVNNKHAVNDGGSGRGSYDTHERRDRPGTCGNCDDGARNGGELYLVQISPPDAPA